MLPTRELEADTLVDGNEIRSDIVGQHATLEELLVKIETLAERFEQADDSSDVGTELRERGMALYQKFGAHLDSEQALLEPALQKAGPDGEKLAHRLRNEHREQRELLKYLIVRLERHPEPTILIARELQNFAGFLRFEMAYEEETLLSEAILGKSGG
jgi:iron-sulfur cluster repair protein YtfE (RIC family)